VGRDEKLACLDADGDADGDIAKSSSLLGALISLIRARTSGAFWRRACVMMKICALASPEIGVADEIAQDVESFFTYADTFRSDTFALSASMTAAKFSSLSGGRSV
jgi:hypothetical protein